MATHSGAHSGVRWPGPEVEAHVPYPRNDSDPNEASDQSHPSREDDARRESVAAITFPGGVRVRTRSKAVMFGMAVLALLGGIALVVVYKKMP